MAVNPRLELKQGQTLTMTTQLQQAIKLLQLNNLELAEFVEQELEKNPFLERDNQDPAHIEGEQSQAEGAGDDIRGEVEVIREERPLDTGDTLEEGGYDYTSSTYAGTGSMGNGKFEDVDYNYENTLADNISLRDYLIDQINVEFIDTKENAIASIMVDYLDEAGYFRTELKEVAERLGCPEDEIKYILSRLQQLQPTGIFACDLSDCLSLQLKEQNRFDPAMEALVKNLDLLAKHDLKKLKDICSVDDEDLMDMIGEIKSLNPKPTSEFDVFIAQTVIPDIFMKPLPKSRGGGWSVELNSDTLPRVLVNKVYYKEISQGAVKKEDKEYLNEQMNTASWLVKAMDQRANTILSVAGELVLQQENFFKFGVEFLKPLVLKDIAEVVGVHESTVSRVTTNKYMGTPRGVFELKYFFSSGVSNTEGSVDISSEAIKAKIKNLTEAEDPDNILSDDDIVKLLKDEDIAIARRTVAKYRESMKIPSSVQRRRIKKIAK